MKLKLILVFLFAASVAHSQNLLTKAVSKLSKGMGKSVNVETSANLEEMTPLVIIESNLHPKQVGTISQTFFDGWVPGGDMAFIMFSQRKSSGFVKVDGTVAIDGKPVEYLTLGMYTQTTPANAAPRKYEITTSTGQKSSFTIAPFSRPPFKIKSINGSADNANLDLTKDVTIEIEPLDLPDNSLLKVSIAINQVSIKSFYEVAFVKSASTITIPAAAFRNINIKPAGNAVYNYKKSYLAVHYETTENASDVSGIFPAVQYVKSYSDGKFVNVTAEPSLNPGLSVKGTANNFSYDAYKAHAFLSRPFAEMKNVGLLSFAIRGTTYQEVSQSSSSTPVRVNPFGGASSTTTVTTITVTRELPWQSLLDELYPEFMGAISSELGGTTVLVEKITSAEAYKIINETSNDDPTTKVEFVKTYKNTKVVSAFMPFSEGYGANSVHQKIMNQTGTDGLLTLTLDLQISQDESTGKMLMIPRLAFEIAGKANGRAANTKFIAGTIESTTVSGFTKDVTAAQLSSLVRKSELIEVFRETLRKMKEQEKANGDYEIVWNLQK